MHTGYIGSVLLEYVLEQKGIGFRDKLTTELGTELGTKLGTELGTELGVVKTIDRANIIVTKQRKTSQVLTPR